MKGFTSQNYFPRQTRRHYLLVSILQLQSCLPSRLKQQIIILFLVSIKMWSINFKKNECQRMIARLLRKHTIRTTEQNIRCFENQFIDFFEILLHRASEKYVHRSVYGWASHLAGNLLSNLGRESTWWRDFSKWRWTFLASSLCCTIWGNGMKETTRTITELYTIWILKEI